MPKPLIFVPCEKIIINELDNTVSLITVIDTVTIAVQGDAGIPEDTLVPQKWHIYTLWHRTLGEEGKSYEQRITLLNPNGTEIINEIRPFTLIEVKHQIVINVGSIPVGVAGQYNINLSIRELGQDTFNEIISYPFVINHIQQGKNEDEDEGELVNE